MLNEPIEYCLECGSIEPNDCGCDDVGVLETAPKVMFRWDVTTSEIRFDKYELQFDALDLAEIAKYHKIQEHEVDVDAVREFYDQRPWNFDLDPVDTDWGNSDTHECEMKIKDQDIAKVLAWSRAVAERKRQEERIASDGAFVSALMVDE